METVPEKTQDIPIEKKAKNPWWLKLVFYALIICTLLDITANGLGLLNGMLIIVWIWDGRRVQKNVCLLDSLIRKLLVLLLVLTLFPSYLNIMKIIEWISTLQVL